MLFLNDDYNDFLGSIKVALIHEQFSDKYILTAENAIGLTTYSGSHTSDTDKNIGADVGCSLDASTRDFLSSRKNVVYSQRAVHRGKYIPVSSRREIDKTCQFRTSDLNYATKLLDSFGAEKIDGGYVAIMHPYIIKQIMHKKEFKDIFRSGRQINGFIGEVGEIGNVRIIEGNSKIWFNHSCPKHGKRDCSRLPIFSTLVLSAHAFKISEVSDDPKFTRYDEATWVVKRKILSCSEDKIIRIESTVDHRDFWGMTFPSTN